MNFNKYFCPNAVHQYQGVMSISISISILNLKLNIYVYSYSNINFLFAQMCRT